MARSSVPYFGRRVRRSPNSLVIEVNGSIAGGGLVLSMEQGQHAVPVDIVPVQVLDSRR